MGGCPPWASRSASRPSRSPCNARGPNYRTRRAARACCPPGSLPLAGAALRVIPRGKVKGRNGRRRTHTCATGYRRSERAATGCRRSEEGSNATCPLCALLQWQTARCDSSQWEARHVMRDLPLGGVAMRCLSLRPLALRLLAMGGAKRPWETSHCDMTGNEGDGSHLKMGACARPWDASHREWEPAHRYATRPTARSAISGST